MKKKITKLLIANRGEIAVRIIRTARVMGIRTVTVFSNLDAGAYYTELSDEVYPLSGDDLSSTYLNVKQLLLIAKDAGCDGLHPGYGFLSENPALAEACKEMGIIYVGPESEVIQTMGNKLAARALVKKLNVPLLEGVEGPPEQLLEQKNRLSYPVLVKAASGGGGKGMRVVEKPEDLAVAIETTSREALASFADATVYIETYLKNPRHIEVQILADQQGNVIHLGERECSIQRRHQKIVEESPSPVIDKILREKMGLEAVKIARSIKYRNAGTIEFLADDEGNFYFLEMNTRIQVEHPVTELVYGVDLIKEQLRIAMGEEISVKQDEVKPRGHAMECRIYAEDPKAGFRPSPGEITLYKEAAGPWIRNDSSINKASLISPQFDPMISKLIVWGKDRRDAISRMKLALEETIIQGIATNISYLHEIMDISEFQSGDFSTSFCEKHEKTLMDKLEKLSTEEDEIIPLISYLIYSQHKSHKMEDNTLEDLSPYQLLGSWRN